MFAISILRPKKLQFITEILLVLDMHACSNALVEQNYAQWGQLNPKFEINIWGCVPLHHT